MSWMPNVWQQEFCQEIIPTMDLTQSTLKELHLSLRADADVDISVAKVHNHVELVFLRKCKFIKPVWKTSKQKSSKYSQKCCIQNLCQPSHHGCPSYRYISVMVDLPWELSWAAGSQQPGWGKVCHGRCVGCYGAVGRWSSFFGPPCALDLGYGQAPAALGARSVTSQPAEGENSGSACRGHAGLGEHWEPQPTQGQI